MFCQMNTGNHELTVFSHKSEFEDILNEIRSAERLYQNHDQSHTKSAFSPDNINIKMNDGSDQLLNNLLTSLLEIPDVWDTTEPTMPTSDEVFTTNDQYSHVMISNQVMETFSCSQNLVHSNNTMFCDSPVSPNSTEPYFETLSPTSIASPQSCPEMQTQSLPDFHSYAPQINDFNDIYIPPMNTAQPYTSQRQRFNSLSRVETSEGRQRHRVRPISRAFTTNLPCSSQLPPFQFAFNPQSNNQLISAPNVHNPSSGVSNQINYSHSSSAITINGGFSGSMTHSSSVPNDFNHWETYTPNTVGSKSDPECIHTTQSPREKSKKPLTEPQKRKILEGKEKYEEERNAELLKTVKYLETRIRTFKLWAQHNNIQIPDNSYFS